MGRRVRFGDFELDIAAYALWCGAERVKLERIPMELLMLLVAKPGVLVDRHAIGQALWGRDVFVDQDAAINTAIRKIRQALRDRGERPRFIETVVAKGYRFVAPIDASVAAGEVERPRFPSYRLMRGDEDFALEEGENLVGRDADARVYLDHPSVSRRHAIISIHRGRTLLRDLGSRNGTFVDGRRIDVPTEIGNGCVVGVGPIILTFVVLTGPASTVPMIGGTAAQP